MKKFLTQIVLFVSVLLNTQARPVTVQRGNKRGYALPLNTEYPSMENLKKFKVIECPLHANNEGILKMENELKYFKKKFFYEIKDRRRSV